MGLALDSKTKYLKWQPWRCAPQISFQKESAIPLPKGT